MLASVASIIPDAGYTIKKVDNIISIHYEGVNQEEFYHEVKNPALIISIGVFNITNDNDQNTPFCIILFANGMLSVNSLAGNNHSDDEIHFTSFEEMLCSPFHKDLEIYHFNPENIQINDTLKIGYDLDDTKFIETHEEGNFGIAVWTNKLIYWDSNSMPNAEFSKNYEDNKKSFLYKQYELENNMNSSSSNAVVITCASLVDVNEVSESFLLHCFGSYPRRMAILGCSNGDILGLSLPATKGDYHQESIELVFQNNYNFPISRVFLHCIRPRIREAKMDEEGEEDQLKVDDMKVKMKMKIDENENKCTHLFLVGVHGELISDGVMQECEHPVREKFMEAIPTRLMHSYASNYNKENGSSSDNNRSKKRLECGVADGEFFILNALNGDIESYSLLEGIWRTLYSASWGVIGIQALHLRNRHIVALLVDGSIKREQWHTLNKRVLAKDSVRQLNPLSVITTANKSNQTLSSSAFSSSMSLSSSSRAGWEQSLRSIQTNISKIETYVQQRERLGPLTNEMSREIWRLAALLSLLDTNGGASALHKLITVDTCVNIDESTANLLISLYCTDNTALTALQDRMVEVTYSYNHLYESNMSSRTWSFPLAFKQNVSTNGVSNNSIHHYICEFRIPLEITTINTFHFNMRVLVEVADDTISIVNSISKNLHEEAYMPQSDIEISRDMKHFAVHLPIGVYTLPLQEVLPVALRENIFTTSSFSSDSLERHTNNNYSLPLCSISNDGRSDDDNNDCSFKALAASLKRSKTYLREKESYYYLPAFGDTNIVNNNATIGGTESSDMIESTQNNKLYIIDDTSSISSTRGKRHLVTGTSRSAVAAARAVTTQAALNSISSIDNCHINSSSSDRGQKNQDSEDDRDHLPDIHEQMMFSLPPELQQALAKCNKILRDLQYEDANITASSNQSDNMNKTSTTNRLNDLWQIYVATRNSA